MTTKMHSMKLAAAFAVLLWPAAAGAQQTPPQQQQRPQQQPSAPAAGADDCMTAQSKVSVTATMARERLETARQTNEPARLRAAVDEALLALGALLAATEPCRTAPAMGGMDHSKMAMPGPGAPVSPRPPAAAADPHAGMKMPAAPAKPGTKPAPKPADPHAGMTMPAAPAKPGAKPAPKPADPHAGMDMPPAGAPTAEDPKTLVCPKPIDPDRAPSTTYKGKRYYFCTAADRLRFIMNPETYLKKQKGPGK